MSDAGQSDRYNAALISSDVCIRCGGCCSVYIHRQSQQPVLLSEVTADAPIEIVSCRHLESTNNRHICQNYDGRPAVCRQYNCLVNANRHGTDIAPGTALGDRIRIAVRLVHGVDIENTSAGG